MKIDEYTYKELSTKSKRELIEEILSLKNGNGNGKSNQTDNFDFNQSDELNKMIVENSHDGIMIIGENYIVEYVNNTLLELTGYSKEELENHSFKDLLVSHNVNYPIKRFDNRRKGLKVSSVFELPITTKNNKHKIFEVRGALFNDSKRSLKTLAQFKDITEHKLAEEAIKQSEAKFRSIVENSHLGILVVNMKFQFEYVNDQLCNILHSTKEKLIGADFRRYISEKSLEMVVDHYKKRQKGIDVPKEYQLTLRRENGEERIARITSTTVNFSGNIKTIAQILDITENIKKRKLQKVLLQISQAVNEVNNLPEFLGIVRDGLSTVLDTTNFYVALYDKNSDTYTFPYHMDEYDSIDEITQLELKDSLTDYVRRKNRAILVNSEVQTKLEDEGEIEGVVGEYCPIWIGAPLVVDNDVVGAICLQDYHHEDTYDKNDLELLQIVSENVSSAIWKKQIFDKLTESELRYRDFISRTSEGIFRIDFDPIIDTSLPPEEQVELIFKFGIIGECNNSFANMYNLKSNKDIIGRNLNFFYGNKISEKNFNANLEFIKNDYTIKDVETNEYNADGEQIVVLNNSIGIIKDGNLVNIWGIQKDITESKKLSNVLQEIAKGISSSTGDSFFKSLVQFLSHTLKVDYAFISQLSENQDSAESLAVWGNNEFKENFTYKVNNTPSQIILKENKTSHITNIDKDYPDDKFLQKHKIKNYMGKPLVSSTGEKIGILAILQKEEIKNIEFTRSVLEIFASRSAAEIERLQHVKEIVAAKEEAERSNSLKSDFLAQMSHEIRTPVNTILSFTSLLRENLENQLEDDLKDSFKIIENGGQRLIRTIDLILNVSQIQSGNLNLSPTRLDLIGIIKNLISEFKQAANKKELSLSFETNHKELTVIADNYTITQIFANLIHNAIKYTHTGSIKLTAEIDSNEEIVLKVNDTGVGMSKEYLTELFDPFSQEETGYTRKFEGTGLGLTLVRKYCELNSAKIIVESKKNEGSTFIVRFKKAEPSQ